MTILNITITGRKADTNKAQLFAGETAEITCLESGDRVWIASHDNRPLAASDGGSISLATTEMIDYLKSVHTGRSVRLPIFIYNGTGAIKAMGFVYVVQAPTTSDPAQIPTDLLSQFVLKSDLVGLEILAASATQREQREKINEVINKLRGVEN